MGSQWVEDPSWGNIFKGLAEQFASAPEEALKQRLTVEQIKNARQARDIEQQNYQRGLASGSAFEKAVPPASVPPSTFTAADIADPAVLDAPPDRLGPSNPDMQFTDPRALSAAEARRNLAITAGKQLLMTHPEQAMPQLGYGSVAAAGVPKTADERSQLEFLTTGKFPDRSVDESKIPPKPYIVLGPDGKVAEQGVTKDFKTNLTTGKPISPGSIQLASPTSPDRPSDFSDKGKMTAEFAALGERVNRGDPLSIPEIERAHVLREQLHPQSAGFQTMGGQQQYVTQRAVPVPEYAARLSDLIDAYRSNQHLQPAPQPAPTAAVVPPNAPAPTAPAPIVPPNVVPGAGGANAPQLGVRGPANPAELRKEVQNTQAFSDYAQAITSYNTMVKAAQGDERTGMPNSASDLNIIYAVAKLFDPGSVVREGELKLASGTAPIADQLSAAYNRLFTGEGSLTPQIRANLIGEGLKRMEQYANAKNTTQKYYEQVAKASGIDPTLAIPPTPPMLPYNRQAIENPSASVLDQADHLVGGGR